MRSNNHPGKLASQSRLLGLASRVILAGLIWLAGSSLAVRAASDAPGKIKIAFAGDSLINNYWSGLTRLSHADACLKSRLDLRRFAKSGSGLANSKFVDWPQEIRRINDLYHPDMTVISMGLNDKQGMIEPNGAQTLWGAPAWADRYNGRLMEFLQGAISTKAIVLFVGLPAMGERAFNADALVKNSMYAKAVARIGDPHLRYVEPWRLSKAGADDYALYGHDRSGRLVQIRNSDGLHFASAGEDLLAAYMLPKIMSALAQAGKDVSECGSPQQKSEVTH
jgi:hypothetical protein